MSGDEEEARRTAWQDAEVAHHFVETTRAAIPYGPDQLAVMRALTRHFRPCPTLLLDLGCGDGAMARAVLAEAPDARAILLDHSPPMLERARLAMARFGDRCGFHLADLLNPITALAAEGSVDLVLSGYAIHHLPDERKRSLYAEIHVLLACMLARCARSHWPLRERRARRLRHPGRGSAPRRPPVGVPLFIDHLAARQGRSRDEVAADYHARPDKADNRLAPVETQLAWLREIGFNHVECPFKWFELAVLAGVKRG